MINGVLESVKKTLGLEKDYLVFDEDILMHINSVFSDLDQLGVGPEGGVVCEGYDETWSGLFGASPKYNLIRTYVFLRVRVLFDPPSTGYLVEAYNKAIEKAEWRLNVTREGEKWTQPILPTIAL